MFGDSSEMSGNMETTEWIKLSEEIVSVNGPVVETFLDGMEGFPTISPSSAPICTLTGKNYQLEPPAVDFLWVFPEELETILDRFDAPIIEFCQKPTGKFFLYLSKVLTGVVAIEYMIVLPIVLYILGIDVLATKIMYLAFILVFLSQIPKRFVWRYRPFMGYRALENHSARTSSFPSRAVACAVVYCYIAVYAYLTFAHNELQWWMFLLFFVMPLLVSFARIHLGVHYPTDCIAGFVLGLLVCVIGKGLFMLDYNGCKCPDHVGICYSDSEVQEITPETLGYINPWVLGGVIVGQFAFALLCVLKPIKFWVKFGAIFGLLFPSLTFRLVFLCPVHQGNRPLAALKAPPLTDLWWWEYCYAIGVVVVGMGIGMKLQKRLLFFVFALYWVFYVSAISLWRLFRPHDSVKI